MEKVNSKTRASRNGTAIFCPFCKKATLVFHFSWTNLNCTQCGIRNKKSQYLVDKRIPIKAKEIRKEIRIYLNTGLLRERIGKTPNQLLIDQMLENVDFSPDNNLVSMMTQIKRIIKGKNLPKSDEFKFKMSIMLMVDYFYDYEEKELRKQKLMLINNVSSRQKQK